MLKAKQTWTIEMVNYELINTTLLGLVAPGTGVRTRCSPPPVALGNTGGEDAIPGASVFKHRAVHLTRPDQVH